MKKIKELKIKHINILDNPKSKRYFRDAMKIFSEIFKEDKYYIKKIRKFLKRQEHPKNTIFRMLVAISKRTVVGCAIYRHWTDINKSTLEYLMARLDLRGQGIGSALYKAVKRDCKIFGSTGLYFSCAGDTDLDEYDIAPEWKDINVKRVKFYERHGARPLKGINYNSPLYWNLPKNSYCYPNFCFDPLRKTKKKERVRVSSDLVKEIVRRIMWTYYGIRSSNSKVRTILKSIKTQKLELRQPKYFKD